MKETATRTGASSKGRRTVLGTLASLVVVGLAAAYLANPGAGVLFDLPPDNLPLVGNLDEAGATAILLYALRYLFRGRGGSAS